MWGQKRVGQKGDTALGVTGCENMQAGRAD